VSAVRWALLSSCPLHSQPCALYLTGYRVLSPPSAGLFLLGRSGSAFPSLAVLRAVTLHQACSPFAGAGLSLSTLGCYLLALGFVVRVVSGSRINPERWLCSPLGLIECGCLRDLAARCRFNRLSSAAGPSRPLVTRRVSCRTSLVGLVVVVARSVRPGPCWQWPWPARASAREASPGRRLSR